MSKLMRIGYTGIAADVTVSPVPNFVDTYQAGDVFQISAPTNYKISRIVWGLVTSNAPHDITEVNVNQSILRYYVDVPPNASVINFTLPDLGILDGTIQRWKLLIEKKLIKVYFSALAIADGITANPEINLGTLYSPSTEFRITAPAGKKIDSIRFYDSSKVPTAADAMTEFSVDTCNFKDNVTEYPLCVSTKLTLPEGEGKVYTLAVSLVDETHEIVRTQLETCITEIEQRALTSSEFANRYLFPVRVQVGDSMVGWGGSSTGVSPAMNYIFDDMAEIQYAVEGSTGWKYLIVKGKLAVSYYDFGGLWEKPAGYVPQQLGPFQFFAQLNRAPVPYTTWNFTFDFLMGYIVFVINHNGKFVAVMEGTSSKGPDQPTQARETFYPPTWDFKDIIFSALTAMGNNPSQPGWTMIMGTKDWDVGAMEQYIHRRYITDTMIQEITDKNQFFGHWVTFDYVNGTDYSQGMYIDPAGIESVSGMAGKYYEKQINTDDCEIVTWSIASQDIPGSPLSINTTGFVSGMIPLTVPAGEYTVVVKAVNTVGTSRFLTLSITVTAYDVSDTFEVLGSSPTAIKYILHHSDDFYLLVDSNRYIYKTTDFVVFETVYDAGLTTRGFTRPHELSDKTVILAMSKAGSNPTYSDTYTLLSDTGVTAFTARAVYESTTAGSAIDMVVSESDATHMILAMAASNRTRMVRVKISDGSKTTVVTSATTSGDRKRLWSMEVAGAGTAPWEKLIFNNVGTSGLAGDNDIWSSVNASDWTVELEGDVSNGTDSASTGKIFYKDTTGNWYVKNNTAIYTSADAGDTWTLVNAGVTQDILNPVFLMATDNLFLQAESGTTNGKVYKSTDACANFTANYTLTNGAKPVILYKDWKGRVLLVTTGTTDNILRAA